jgi:hypothetical protein
MAKIDSVYDFSDKALVELKSWLEPWFLQKPDVEEPDVDIGGGGGGIQFDTYPQAGNWLYVETDDESGAGGSPTGYGLELSDYSAGGAFLGALGGGDLHLKASAGGGIQMTSTGGITISDSSQPVLVQALSDIATLTGKGAYVLNADVGGIALLATAAGGTTVGVGMYVRVEESRFVLHRSAGGDPTVEGTPWLVIDTASTGSYHIKSGKSWVADL